MSEHALRRALAGVIALAVSATLLTGCGGIPTSVPGSGGRWSGASASGGRCTAPSAR